MLIDYKKLLSQAIIASYEAGLKILKVYNSDFAVEQKEDNSPLTLADKKSHDTITQFLINNSYIPDFPILSEEGRDIPFEERNNWEYFWMIDPLDGTKEFIKRNGEFTVNIALIHDSRPVLGVVYIPVKRFFYFSANCLGSYKLELDEDNDNHPDRSILDQNFDGIIQQSKKLPIIIRDADSSSEITVIASRSHMNKETEEFIDNLKSQYSKVELISAGSSLKLCLVAEGSADIYPRIAPTMEWDTAAAHSVVNGAGRKVMVHGEDEELRYNKKDLLNLWFVVE